MKIYCAIGDSAGWCWATTAREVVRHMPEHEFVIAEKGNATDAAKCDLIWCRGYPTLFPCVKDLGKPFAWQYTTGGGRAQVWLSKCRDFVLPASGIICQNHEALGIIEREGARFTALIPNGVDCERFHMAEHPPERFVVGCAANINGERWEGKGARWLVEACDREDLTLTLATNPKGGRRADADGGRIAHEDMPAWYRSLSVYSQTSTSEGCSNSIHEAMASGLPCIICRESGYHGEECHDGRTDLGGEVVIVPPADLEALADALLWLRDNPDDAARIGRNARRFARRHGWDTIAARHREFFEQAVTIPPIVKGKPGKAAPRAPEPFGLVTVCEGEEYAQCLALTLPTWLAHAGAETIWVYGDDHAQRAVADIGPDAAGVRFEHIEPAETWLDCVMRKASLLCDHCDHAPDGARVVFVDADCATVKPLTDLGALAEDIGVARFSFDASDNARHRGTANVGLIALRVNSRTRAFLRAWAGVQYIYACAKHGIQPGTVAADQFAFTDLARGRVCNVTIATLPEERWNNYADKRPHGAWLAAIARECPAVLHFKGGAWKDADAFAAAVKAAQDATPRRASLAPGERGPSHRVWRNGRLVLA